MGLFGGPGSDEKRAEEARTKAMIHERQNAALKSAYRGSDDSAKFIAFSNVYVSGGQVDGAIWGFDKNNAETALRDYISLLESL
jgi:hypothetical protein